MENDPLHYKAEVESVIVDLNHYSEIGSTDNWWFKGKNELVKSFIKGKSLNVGGGLTDIGDVIVDNDKRVVEMNPKAKFGNAYGLPDESNSFDTVIISDVLEHLKYDELAVNEIKTVLKERGIVIVTVPAYKFLFSEHDEILGHYRRYNKGMLEDLFKKAGFKTKKLCYWNFFLFPGVVLVKLLSKGLNLKKTNKFVDSFFLAILKLENILIKYINFPFGGTVFGVFEK